MQILGSLVSRIRWFVQLALSYLVLCFNVTRVCVCVWGCHLSLQPLGLIYMVMRRWSSVYVSASASLAAMLGA